MSVDWNTELRSQTDWHWSNQLRPRLEGLTDDEYFWEPAQPSWSVRPREVSTAPLAGGAGDLVIEFAFPPPDPAPVTTIAWRLGHLIVCLTMRTASHFGGPADDYGSHHYAATADEALDQLDEAYAGWIHGVESLGEGGLARACGPAEGPFADSPMAGLVLHIDRKLLHHGAEIALLRDLHRARPVRD